MCGGNESGAGLAGGWHCSSNATKRAIRWRQRNAAPLGVLSKAAAAHPKVRKSKTDGPASAKWADGGAGTLTEVDRWRDARRVLNTHWV